MYVRTYMLIAKACVFTFGWVWAYINSAYKCKNAHGNANTAFHIFGYDSFILDWKI